MNRCVVFCSDAYTALGLIRSLGESQHIVDVITYGDCDYLLSSKYIDCGKKFKSRKEALNYLIKDYPSYKDKPILFTIPDPPAYDVDCHLDEIKKKFIVMNAGKQNSLTKLMQKDYINQMAHQCGLNIPYTIIVKKGSKLPDISKFPVFTKSICSTTGGGKGDEFICYNQCELEDKVKKIQNDFLITQFIFKKKEINYYGIAKNGNIYIDYKDERTRFSNHAYGHYSMFSLCEKDKTYDSIIQLMKKTKYEGIFDVEFLEDEAGILWFLEVNFRTDGAIYRLSPVLIYPIYGVLFRL